MGEEPMLVLSDLCVGFVTLKKEKNQLHLL